MTETLEVVDLCLPGLNCPMPVPGARRPSPRWRAAPSCASSAPTGTAWPIWRNSCRQTGHELVSQNTDEAAGEYVTVIRRAARTDLRPVRTLIKVPEASAWGPFFHARPKKDCPASKSTEQEGNGYHICGIFTKKPCLFLRVR